MSINAIGSNSTLSLTAAAFQVQAESARQHRDEARAEQLTRRAEFTARSTELAAARKEVIAAANKGLAAGLISGALQIGASGYQLDSAAASAAGDNAGVKACDAMAQRLNGLAKFADAYGATAGFNQARRLQHDARAEQHQTRAQDSDQRAGELRSRSDRDVALANEVRRSIADAALAATKA